MLGGKRTEKGGAEAEASGGRQPSKGATEQEEAQPPIAVSATGKQKSVRARGGGERER